MFLGFLGYAFGQLAGFRKKKKKFAANAHPDALVDTAISLQTVKFFATIRPHGTKISSRPRLVLASNAQPSVPSKP